MQISYEWLMDLMPERIEIEELSEILTSIGLEVEAIERIEQIKGGLEGVVVGEVMTCLPHPNADKLKITKVKVSDDIILPIVCGAPNVAQGQKVLVATVGSTLYGNPQQPLTIKSAKIRGEQSEGMICAEDEIGIGNSHDGIMVLDTNAVVGTPAAQYLNLPSPQTTIHIGITPNRIDGMNHLGVARDVIAYLNHHKNKNYSISVPESTIAITTAYDQFSINIQDNELCPRYAGLIIDNIVVATSPQWIQERLIAVGLRPINNVVDITNLVLMELGQPLHAFDFDKIDTGITVRNFPKDTLFTTLDGKERKLHEDDIMIADHNKPLCIAGVMGGNNSGVNDATTKIFLESAYFNPKSIRRTSQRHQLRTDAAIRFEKTANIDMVIPALNMAAKLIIEICGGKISSPIIDVYPHPIKKVNVSCYYKDIYKISGKEYGKEQIDNILKSLDFEIVNEDNERLEVLVPYSKNEIAQTADIAEEIIRIDGLNNIDISNKVSYSFNPLQSSSSHKRKIKRQIAEWLTANGLNEMITNSIINQNDFPDATNLVTMINSLTSELNAMRPQMLQSGLEVLSYNINRKNNNLAVYEIGNVYRKENGEYIQEEKLAIWVTGERQSKQWQTVAIRYDFYYLKGLVNRLLKYCGVSRTTDTVDENCYSIYTRNKPLASIESINNTILKKYDISQDVYYAEIDLKLLFEDISSQKVVYKEVNKFPVVSRDLALVLDKKITYQDIEKSTRKAKVKELLDFHLFDIYEGEKIGNENRSWAINYQFESKEKTFTDSEIDAIMKSLMNTYEKELNASIRH